MQAVIAMFPRSGFTWIVDFGVTGPWYCGVSRSWVCLAKLAKAILWKRRARDRLCGALCPRWDHRARWVSGLVSAARLAPGDGPGAES